MDKLADTTLQPREIGCSPAGRGGKRAGAGRPKGVRNPATLAREAVARGVEAEAAAGLTLEQIRGMSALDIMELAMHFHVGRGNFSTAAEIAARVAPYRHARVVAPVELGPTREAQLSAAQMIAADPDPEHDPRGSAVNTRQCTGPHAPAAQGGS